MTAPDHTAETTATDVTPVNRRARASVTRSVGMRSELRRVAATAIVPAALLGLLLVVTTAAITLTAALAGQRDLATIASRVFTERLDRSQATIDAALAARGGDDQASIERSLALALRTDETLADIALYAGPFERIAVLDPQRLRPRVGASSDLVTAALAAGEPRIDTIRFDEDRRFVVVQIAVPTDVGIAVGTIRLDDVAPLLEQFSIGESSDVYVVQDGAVALHPDLSLQLLARPVDPDRRIVQSLEGAWSVRSSAEIADVGAVVVAEQPLRVTLVPVLAAAGIVLFAGAVGLAWSLRGWRRLEREIIGPIDRLVAATEAIRTGAVPPDRERFDVAEIDTLATAVGAMADEIRRRVLAIEASNAQLAASNRELEQVAYAASHDLQAPLRTIAGFLDLYDEHLAASGVVVDERARHLRRRVDDGVRSMYDLIDGLLRYSRVTTRGSSLDQDVDLTEVVGELRRDLAHDLRTSGATLRADDLPTLRGDPVQLRQVLQNLVENAVKFRSPERDPEITISADRDDRGWVVSVADNGIGIPERFRDRVFVMFRRLHPAEEYEGQGLGLALCRRIVERHGGTIEVDGTPGGGSTFRFWLPDRPSPHDAATRTTPDERSAPDDSEESDDDDPADTADAADAADTAHTGDAGDAGGSTGRGTTGARR